MRSRFPIKLDFLAFIFSKYLFEIQFNFLSLRQKRPGGFFNSVFPNVQ